MNIWRVLGIDETIDVQEIKRAYREKLRGFNPEDDPEGFMELRNAYEEAVSACERSSDVKTDESVIYKRLRDLYDCFTDRINVEEWNRLFLEDAFVLLDTEQTAFSELMDFIANNPYLPHTVYKCIVEHFDMYDRNYELREEYGDGFIEYFFSRAERDYINYYLFSGDYRDVDEYIENFRDAMDAYENIDEVRRYLKRLDNLSVYNPYGEVFKIWLELDYLTDYSSDNTLAEIEEYAERLLEIAGKYSDDSFISICVAEYYCESGQYDAAESVLKNILKRDPSYYRARNVLGQLYFDEQKYSDARDVYLEMLRENGRDANAYNMFFKINKGLIEEYKRMIEEDKADNNVKIELCWSLYQCGRAREAVEILNTISPDAVDKFSYYNCMGRCCLDMEKYDKALEYFMKWKSEIEALGDDNSEDSITKRKRLPFVSCLIGRCYYKLKQYDKALMYMEEAVSAKPEKSGDYFDNYDSYIELLFDMGDFVKCLAVCDEQLKSNRCDMYFVYCYKAKACYELGYLQECVYICERAIALYKYSNLPYVMEIKAFRCTEQYEDAKGVIERFRRINPDSDVMTFYEAVICRAQGNDERAYELILKLDAEYVPDKSDLSHDDYIEMLFVAGDICDDRDEDKAAIDFYDRIIALEPDNTDVHGYQAYMYIKIGDTDAALKEYMLQLSVREHPSFYTNIGRIYFKRLEYDKAIEYTKKALELDRERKSSLKLMAHLCQLTDNYTEALNCCDKFISLTDDNDDVDAIIEVIKLRSKILSCMNRHDESCTCLEAAIKKYKTDDIVLIYTLALTYTRADRYEDAKRLLSDYIEHGKDERDIHWCASLLMELAGEENDMEAARDAYRKAVSIGDGSAGVYSKFGRILVMNGFYAEAVLQYKLAVEKQDDNNYCELLYAIRLSGDVIDHRYKACLDKAMELENNAVSPDDYIKLSKLYRALNDFKRAHECLNKAVTMNRCCSCGYSGCEDGYYELGCLYEALGDKENAIRAYEQAIKTHGHCYVYEKRRVGVNV